MQVRAFERYIPFNIERNFRNMEDNCFITTKILFFQAPGQVSHVESTETGSMLNSGKSD